MHVRLIIGLLTDRVIYLEVKTWLFDKRPRKFSPRSINARSRAFMERGLIVRGVYQTAMF